MKLRWSPRARQDLVNIGRYISQDDRAAARAWVERLRQRARLVTEHPLSGRIVPEYRRQDLREVLQGNYRIVYLVRKDAIEVVTVFEGHRLLPEEIIEEEVI